MRTLALPLAVFPLATSVLLAAPAARAQQPDDRYVLPDPPPTAPTAARTRASEPPEPPAPRFGEKGELVVTGDSSAGVSTTSYDGSNASSFSAGLSPALHYFLAKDVSVGLSFSFSYGDGKGYGADGSLIETKSTGASGGATLGYNVRLGETFSFWPQVTVGFEWVRQTEELVSGTSLSTAGSPLGYPSTTRLGPYVSVYAPVLVHPKPHFFAGIGPSFFHDFGPAQGGPAIGGQRTTFGGGFIVGVWLGGPAAKERAPREGTPRYTRHFGDAGEWVLANDISIAVHGGTYAGSGSSWSSVSFAPGADYFATDHFSVGLGLSASYSRTNGPDATTGANVSNSYSRFGIGPRLGYDFPLGPGVSFYPRLTIGFAVASYDERSGAAADAYGEQIVYASAYAPLLFHPVTHVFAGFGPSISQDLTRAEIFTGGSVQNRATTLGAGFTLGGWL